MEAELSASPSGSVELDLNELSDNFEELIEALDPHEIKIASPPMSEESSTERNQELCYDALNGSSDEEDRVEGLSDEENSSPAFKESPFEGRIVPAMDLEPEMIEMPVESQDIRAPSFGDPTSCM